MVVFLWNTLLMLLFTLCCAGFSPPDVSSSPPGPYQQDAYVIRAEEKFKHPPFLPPHLLQVLLNKDTGISVSSEPTHTHHVASGTNKQTTWRLSASATPRCFQSPTTWCSTTCTPCQSRWVPRPQHLHAFILTWRIAVVGVADFYPSGWNVSELCHTFIFFLVSVFCGKTFSVFLSLTDLIITFHLEKSKPVAVMTFYSSTYFRHRLYYYFSLIYQLFII